MKIGQMNQNTTGAGSMHKHLFTHLHTYRHAPFSHYTLLTSVTEQM